jgi:hypothetical protein
MPRVQGDGKRVYITRKQMHPRLLSKIEWTEVFEESQVFPARSPVPEKLLNDLNGAVDAYTKYGPGSLKTLTVGELAAKVNAWLNRTDSLRKELSKTTRKQKVEYPVLHRSKSLKLILEKYFEQDRFLSRRLSVDDLVLMMEGTVKLGHAILNRVNETSARRVETIDFWLIWGALLISIFRKHRVKYAPRTKAGKVRQQFRPEIIDFIDLLQQKLPHLTWARRKPDSISKALRLVLPFARKKNIAGLKKVLKIWSAGSFEAYDGQELMKLRGIHFQTARILGLFDESKDQLRSLNRNTRKNSNSNSSTIS